MVRGYRIRYHIWWDGPRTSYNYQRFFRAIYGYTQVVVKSNGKSYIYHRPGVLTPYPYIREARKVVIVPDMAAQALIDFFKTGKNPAHNFQDLKDWNVSYTIEEAKVSERDALTSIIEALMRLRWRGVSVYEMLEYPDHTADELEVIERLTRPLRTTEWYTSLLEEPILSKLELLVRSYQEGMKPSM